ncbi:MAG: hypothetical protein HQK49_01860 [Oligoflexia bacterium]|nr:hypothetical protein [Oligoflexia bacterium]
MKNKNTIIHINHLSKLKYFMSATIFTNTSLIFLFIISFSFLNIITSNKGSPLTLYASDDLSKIKNTASGYNLVSANDIGDMMCGFQEFDDPQIQEVQKDQKSKLSLLIKSKEFELFNCLGDNFYASRDWDNNYAAKFIVARILNNYYQLKGLINSHEIIITLNNLIKDCKKIKSTAKISDVTSNKEFLLKVKNGMSSNSEDIYEILSSFILDCDQKTISAENFNYTPQEKKINIFYEYKEDNKTTDVTKDIDDGSHCQSSSIFTNTLPSTPLEAISPSSDLPKIINGDQKIINKKSELLRCLGDKFDLSNLLHNYSVMLNITKYLNYLYTLNMKDSSILKKLDELLKYCQTGPIINPKIKQPSKIKSNKEFLNIIEKQYLLDPSENRGYNIIKTHLSGYLLCGNKVKSRAEIKLILKFGLHYYKRTCISVFGNRIYNMQSLSSVGGLGIGVDLSTDTLSESKRYKYFEKKHKVLPLRIRGKWKFDDKLISHSNLALLFGTDLENKNGEIKQKATFGIGFGIDTILSTETGIAITKKTPTKNISSTIDDEKSSKIISSIDYLVTKQGVEELNNLLKN